MALCVKGGRRLAARLLVGWRVLYPTYPDAGEEHPEWMNAFRGRQGKQ